MQFFIDGKLASQINLAAQIGMLAALYVGYYFAKKKKIRPQHANIQTGVVLLNLFFIIFIMGVTFVQVAASGAPLTEFPNPVIYLHALMGAIAELCGLYLIVRMRTKWLPPKLRVKNFKRLMQFTLALWTATALFGMVIYGSFYLGLGG